MITNSLPLVSIIIPSYNHSKYIGKALNSLLSQTYENWEAIIIDNYSCDGTEKIVSKFSDGRIKFFKIYNDGIIAKSRNFGINLAKGEWIAFLDTDDWWTFDKLEICFENINDDVDFIYHDLEIKYDKPKLNNITRKFKGRRLKKPILMDLLVGGIFKGNAIGNSSVIVRKNILNRVGNISENINLVASEDYNTWLRIAKITDNFKYVEKKLGYYLIHDFSAQKRDLSVPHRQAVLEFMELFNDKQKLNFEVKMKYMSANYNNLKDNFEKAKNDLMFVLKNGDINFKIRAFLKYLIISFK